VNQPDAILVVEFVFNLTIMVLINIVFPVFAVKNIIGLSSLSLRGGKILLIVRYFDFIQGGKQ